MKSNCDFTAPKNIRIKLYLLLDCETATLPFLYEVAQTEKQRKNVAIAKPLIYDIAWRIVDRYGNIYASRSFLVQETFFVPSIFNTAYYKEKRPRYMEKYQTGGIVCKPWREIESILYHDLQHVAYVGAYNSMFDFKKAIPFTCLYIGKLYSENYQEWEDNQKIGARAIACGDKNSPNPNFDGNNFVFNFKKYPMFDLWGMACIYLLNNKNYKNECLANGWFSASAQYFSTNAERTYNFLSGTVDFQESHTALEDVIIETEIFRRIMERKKKFVPGLIYFPFNELGMTIDYALKGYQTGKLPVTYIDGVLGAFRDYLQTYDGSNKYFTQAGNKLLRAVVLRNEIAEKKGEKAVYLDKFTFVE